jgi:hypothetical protein
MPEEILDSTLTIIAIGISQYDNLQKLAGPVNDIENITRILTSNEKISIFSKKQFICRTNLTLAEIQQIIIDYAHNRSATGDKLLFYFSGHGAVVNASEFYFCMKDTKLGFENKGIIPLSALSIREIINTLSAFEILPCFIIDACFSGTSINTEKINIGLNIEYIANQSLGNMYAILASSNADSFSYGDSEGGYFSKALLNTLNTGLPKQKHDEFITLQNISTAINERLSKDGYPLARLHIGKSYPELPLCKNKKYVGENRIERMVPSYKILFSLLWNNGNPISITPEELRADHPSAYGNNKKMIDIWGLLEQDYEDGKRVRFLSEKGIQFCRDELEIPKEMIREPGTEEWSPKQGTQFIKYSEL